jgi:hypothetical protein
VLVAGGKVVQADDGMVFSEQGFDQIEADEAGCAGDYQALLTCDLGLLSLLGVGGSFGFSFAQFT